MTQVTPVNALSKPAQSSPVYGPVASRRLGRSLGIDLVPFKTCTYDCAYCQLGATTRKTVERAIYMPEEALRNRLADRLKHATAIDYVTVAGSGEPTLHWGLGRIVRAIKQHTKTPVAVLTNGSLLWERSVQEDLEDADVVIPTLAAGTQETFARIHRPHAELDLQKVVEGMLAFRGRFAGQVWLEVFIVPGLNTTPRELSQMARTIARMRPDRVHLNTATRPACEAWVRPAEEAQLRAIAAQLRPDASVIAEQPEVAPSAAGTGDPETMLQLLARRPCTVQDVAAGLGLHATEAAKGLQQLRECGRATVEHRAGKVYYRAQGVQGATPASPGAAQVLPPGRTEQEFDR